MTGPLGEDRLLLRVVHKVKVSGCRQEAHPEGADTDSEFAPVVRDAMARRWVADPRRKRHRHDRIRLDERMPQHDFGP